MLINFLRALPFLAIVGVAGYGYHWFVLDQKENTIVEQKETIRLLREELAALKVSTQTQQATIEKLEKTREEQQQAIARLDKRTDQLARERDEYLSIFRRHDLTKLSVAKPGLIEPRINNGTREVFEDLENTTKELENEETKNRFDNFTYDTN